MDYCLTGAKGCTLIHPISIAEIRSYPLLDTLDMYHRTQACYDARCSGVSEEWELEETLGRVERMLVYLPSGSGEWHPQQWYGGMQRQRPRRRDTESQQPRQRQAERQRPSRRQAQNQRQRPIFVEVEEPDDDSQRRRPVAGDDIEVEEVME